MVLLQIIFGWLLFTAIIGLVFFIPGHLFIRKFAWPVWLKLGSSIVTGMVLWTYQGFVLGYLHWREGTYVYLLGCLGWWGWINRQQFDRRKWSLIWQSFKRVHLDKGLLVILVIGIVFQLSAVWPWGATNDQGLLFCCRGVPDLIYHTALINSLTKNMPPFEPGAFGVVVRNYHYWYNLMAADLIRLFHFNVYVLSMHYLALLFTFLFTGSLVGIGTVFRLPKNFTRWFVFFCLFFGDGLYLVRAILGQGFTFDVEIFDDATKLLANPGRAFSLLIFFWSLILFTQWLKRRSLSLDILLVLMFASLVGFKIYTFVFVGIGLFSVSLLFVRHKDFKRLILPILTLIIGVSLYLPVNAGTGNDLWFHPPYIIHNFIQLPSLHLSVLELRRIIFLAHHNWFKAILYEGLFAGIFFISVYGTLLTGFIITRKSWRSVPREIHLFLIPGILITLFLGIFSSQSIGGTNTVQFAVALPYFLSFYAALWLCQWRLAKRSLQILLTVLIVGFTLPRVVYEFGQNVKLLSGRQEIPVPPQQMAALSYLKAFPEGLVMLPPAWANEESMLYVPVLADKPLYLAGQDGLLRDHGITEGSTRLDLNRKIFSIKRQPELEGLLAETGITYIYGPTAEVDDLISQTPLLISIFTNEAVTIARYSP